MGQGSAEGQQRREKKKGPWSNSKDQQGKGGSSLRSRTRRNRPRKFFNASESEKFLKTYESLIKNHNDRRRIYFDNYHKGGHHRQRKLELAFFDAVENLRAFEDKITETQRKLVEKNKWILYGEDRTYSKNRSLTVAPECQEEQKPPSPSSSPDETYEDPMTSPVQLKRKSFKDDREESLGTMEDYTNYRSN